MTKEEIVGLYNKALRGGVEMLERAAELDSEAKAMSDPGQMIYLMAMASELRNFYEIMFND